MIGGSIIIQVLVWGIILGCIYALAASGFSLIFGVTKVINLAHGELIMIGGYVSFWLAVLTGLNPYLFIPLAVAVSSVISIVFYSLGFHKIMGAEKLREAFLAIGFTYVIENMAVLMWKEDTRVVPSPYRQQFIVVGGFNLGVDQLITIAGTAIVLLAFFFFIMKTKWGKMARAVSQNREAAMMIGVNVVRIDMLTFAVSGAMAGVGGALLGVILYLNPYMGLGLTIMAFTIVVFGGMGSILGAVVGAIILGIAQQYAVFFLGGEWSYAVAFALLILILVLRPQGLFGGGG
ncbi:MAG: branched-chain amino acid ABC transporter permease [Candidatus Hecatellales archaeon]|nr:MAG: branched-chain amino acid ABC transporter permease [Candidatus Hecatellales archaeon]